MTAPIEIPKLIRPTFNVNYWDDKDNLIGTDIIKPMPFKGKNGAPAWIDLISLQEKLIHLAVYETAEIGSFLHLPQGLDIIRKMAAMLIVVGKSERGINLDNLLDAGDYPQIARIFLSEDYDDRGTPPRPYTPSLIARIHGMNFEGKLDEISKIWRQKRIMEEIQESVAQTAAELTPTPPPTKAEEEVIQGEMMPPTSTPRLAQAMPIST